MSGEDANFERCPECEAILTPGFGCERCYERMEREVEDQALRGADDWDRWQRENGGRDGND